MFSSFISFSLAIISCNFDCCNFNLDFLFLVASIASSGLVSCVGSSVGILSKFFTGNYLLKSSQSLWMTLKSPKTNTSADGLIRRTF